MLSEFNSEIDEVYFKIDDDRDENLLSICVKYLNMLEQMHYITKRQKAEIEILPYNNDILPYKTFQLSLSSGDEAKILNRIFLIFLDMFEEGSVRSIVLDWIMTHLRVKNIGMVLGMVEDGYELGDRIIKAFGQTEALSRFSPKERNGIKFCIVDEKMVRNYIRTKING